MHCWNWSFFFVLDDKWIGHPLAQQFPELYSFAINNNVSLANVLDTQNLAYVFHRPLSNQTFLQFKELMGQSDACFLFNWLWKCAGIIKHKIFFWLAMHDKINSTEDCSSVNPSIWNHLIVCFAMNQLRNLPFILSGTAAQSCWESIAPITHKGFSFFDEVTLLHQLYPSKGIR